VDIRPCMHSPCLNNGTCVENTTALISTNGNSNSSYTCECGEYYYGTNCEYRLDLCQNETCSNNGYCTMESTQNVANCTCIMGYSGVYCETELESTKIIKTVTSIASVIPLFVFAGIYLMMFIIDVFNMCTFKPKVYRKKPIPRKLHYYTI
jgi:hypothetical protein